MTDTRAAKLKRITLANGSAQAEVEHAAAVLATLPPEPPRPTAPTLNDAMSEIFDDLFGETPKKCAEADAWYVKQKAARAAEAKAKVPARREKARAEKARWKEYEGHCRASREAARLKELAKAFDALRATAAKPRLRKLWNNWPQVRVWDANKLRKGRDTRAAARPHRHKPPAPKSRQRRV